MPIACTALLQQSSKSTLQKEYENHGYNDKRYRKPSGQLAEQSLIGTRLVLAEEGFSTSGDGTAQTGGSAGLEQYNGNNGEADDQIYNIDNDFHYPRNLHGLMQHVQL